MQIVPGLRHYKAIWCTCAAIIVCMRQPVKIKDASFIHPIFICNDRSI